MAGIVSDFLDFLFPPVKGSKRSREIEAQKRKKKKKGPQASKPKRRQGRLEKTLRSGKLPGQK